jgi:multidrug efflux pump subunit AcrA (membrane-fusion protein)
VIEFDNPQMILKFGITVDVYIETYTKEDALVLKMKDLIKENDQFFVYKIENGQALKKPVVTGNQYKLNIEIVKGLQPGDEIVIQGQMLLADGSKVRIIE